MMKYPPDEFDLALRACNGDIAALAELVECYRTWLFAAAVSELRNYDDAHDAVASTIVQVCLHIQELRQPTSIRPWMKAILRNEVRLLARSRARAGRESQVSCQGETARGETEPTVRLDVQRALTRLPKEHARAVALHYLTGLSVRQVADRLGKPEGTIKRWLHAGRSRLALEMEDYAPMKQEVAACIVHSDLDPDVLGVITDALRSAGFDAVRVITDLQSVFRLEEYGEGENQEFHFPSALQGSRLVILDEWIGGRSAFEVYSLLKAAKEAPGTGFCLLTSDPSASTLLAGWTAGFDMFFAKEKLDDSFRACVQKWLAE